MAPLPLSTPNSTPIAPTLDSEYPELTAPQTTLTLTGATGWVEYEPLYAI